MERGEEREEGLETTILLSIRLTVGQGIYNKG